MPTSQPQPFGLTATNRECHCRFRRRRAILIGPQQIVANPKYHVRMIRTTRTNVSVHNVPPHVSELVTCNMHCNCSDSCDAIPNDRHCANCMIACLHYVTRFRIGSIRTTCCDLRCSWEAFRTNRFSINIAHMVAIECTNVFGIIVQNDTRSIWIIHKLWIIFSIM